MSCESCGADTDDLAPVHRKYVTHTPATGDTVTRVLDDTEQWCVSCRTQYPHEPAAE